MLRTTDLDNLTTKTRARIILTKIFCLDKILPISKERQISVHHLVLVYRSSSAELHEVLWLYLVPLMYSILQDILLIAFYLILRSTTDCMNTCPVPDHFRGQTFSMAQTLETTKPFLSPPMKSLFLSSKVVVT